MEKQKKIWREETGTGRKEKRKRVRELEKQRKKGRKRREGGRVNFSLSLPCYLGFLQLPTTTYI